MIALREDRLEGEILYRGRILTLRRDRVRLPQGKEALREVVDHAVAVGVVAENDRGEILLVRQFRYAVGEELLEIPAGLVEPGEDVRETAHRELREETGFDAEEMTPLGRFYSSPGFCNEEIVLFLGRHLKPDPRPQDDDERIVLCPTPRQEVKRLLREGRLKDGKTLVALHQYLRMEDDPPC